MDAHCVFRLPTQSLVQLDSPAHRISKDNSLVEDILRLPRESSQGKRHRMVLPQIGLIAVTSLSTYRVYILHRLPQHV